MQSGDRVRLARVLAMKMQGRAQDKRHRVDWRTRRGTILSVSVVADSVAIKWDDRVTIDHWPQRALEVIHEP